MPHNSTMRRRTRGMSPSGLVSKMLGLLALAIGSLTLPAVGEAQGRSGVGYYEGFEYKMNSGWRTGSGRASRSASSDEEKGSKRRTQRARVASSSSDDHDSPRRARRSGGGGGGVSWNAPSSCLPGSLKSAIAGASQYGHIVVTSTARSASRNRAVGGASRSYHLSCQAVDFRVHGNVSAAISYLRNSGLVGGFHHYGGGLFHIDSGPRRSW